MQERSPCCSPNPTGVRISTCIQPVEITPIPSCLLLQSPQSAQLWRLHPAVAWLRLTPTPPHPWASSACRSNSASTWLPPTTWSITPPSKWGHRLPCPTWAWTSTWRRWAPCTVSRITSRSPTLSRSGPHLSCRPPAPFQAWTVKRRVLRT